MTIPDRTEIARIVLTSLRDEGVAVPENTAGLSKLRLIGSGALLKSVTLVAMLVGVEERLAEEAGIEVSLMDERAMSQSRSPFRNVEALVDYIAHLVKQAAT